MLEHLALVAAYSYSFLATWQMYMHEKKRDMRKLDFVRANSGPEFFVANTLAKWKKL